MNEHITDIFDHSGDQWGYGIDYHVRGYHRIPGEA